MTTPVPIERIDFILTAQQLNTITLNGQRDATNGRVFGDRLYDNNETGLLDNATVKILNDLTANLIANPIDVATIDRMITDQEPDTKLMERFGDIFFYLVETQIYEQHNKIGIPKIEENDTQWSAVIGVNDPGPHVDAVFVGQTRSWGDARIGTGRTGNAKIRSHQGALPRGDGAVDRARQIQTGGVGAAPRG